MASLAQYGPRLNGLATGITAVLIGAAFLALIGLAPLWDTDHYQALAAGISTAVVLVSLPVAVATLRRDGAHRRADRTIALHEALTSGEIQAARTRVARLLTTNGANGRVRRATKSDFDNNLSSYSDPADREFDPRRDVRALLRYFERVEALLEDGALSDRLVHRLICRHAYWWVLALPRDPNDYWAVREGLSEVVAWGRRYEARHQDALAYMDGWGRTRLKNFGTDEVDGE